MRELEAGFVHRVLERVGQRVVADAAVDGRPAGVPGEGRGQDFVVALERRKHQLPGAPGVGEAVQGDERRAVAAAMRRREHREHRRNARRGAR